MKNCKRAVIFLIAMFLAFTSYAQSVKIIADKDSITIGDAVKLTLYAENINSQSFRLLEWFQLPDTLSHFRILSAGKIDTLKINEKYFYSQEFKITSFDSGTWQIPGLELKLAKAGETTDTVLNTFPLTIKIAAFDVSGIKDVHDIKDIIVVPYTERNYILPGSLVLVVLIMVAIWLLLKKSKRGSQNKKENFNSLGRAMEQLDLLQASTNMPGKGFHHQLYQVFKQYFFKRFNHENLSYTNTEWAASLKNIAINEGIKNDLSKLLEELDNLRFSEFDTAYNKEALIEGSRGILKKLELSAVNDKTTS